MYKEALKQDLKFPTSKGPLTIQQVFTLPIGNEKKVWRDDELTLDKLAVVYEAELEESGKKKSFLATKTVKDKTAKLRFDIVVDILNTKVEEAEKLSTAKENREWNQKIMAELQDRKDGALKGKTDKQLLALLKKEEA